MALGLLTLDVEDWDHANFFALDSRRGEIASEVRRRRYAMDANTDRWIELLGRYGATSTCFVLGEFAARYPEAVRRLAAAGHEIASHGPNHELIYRMSQLEFREFLKRGLSAIGELTGQTPIGFRAPSWSVDHRTPWFCEELAQAGIRYDSSLFPVRTPLFGRGDHPLGVVCESGVLRLPVPVLELAGFRWPFSCGAFFRLSPLWLIRLGLSRAQSGSVPPMLVLHPRELDPDHPRLLLGCREGFVHYAGLRTTVPKLRRLLPEAQWVSIRLAYGPRLNLP